MRSRFGALPRVASTRPPPGCFLVKDNEKNDDDDDDMVVVYRPTKRDKNNTFIKSQTSDQKVIWYLGFYI